MGHAHFWFGAPTINILKFDLLTKYGKWGIYSYVFMLGKSIGDVFIAQKSSGDPQIGPRPFLGWAPKIR